MLPYSTAFILVTGDASYAQVQEAAEATVDGFLVKPCSGLALAERLTEVRRRKRTLKAIYEAIQARELLRAAALAEQRFVALTATGALPPSWRPSCGCAPMSRSGR